jgi:hypothetical protein
MIDTHGFETVQQCLNTTMLYDLIYSKHTWDRPIRGHDIRGEYHSYANNWVTWESYYTPKLNTHPRIANIRSVTDDLVAPLLNNPVFYHSDCSVMMPTSMSIRPRVSVPHRHTPWANDTNRLAIHIAVPLHDGTSQNGMPAFLPHSQDVHWDINKCFNGDYDAVFTEDSEQPKTRFGDIVMWDSRTLYSQMPNAAMTNRYTLLLSYVEKDMLSHLQSYEATIVF